jgi:hypothetical protein
VKFETEVTNFGYVVTAKHVIAAIKSKNLDKVYLRVNTYDGFRYVETNIDRWRDHPDDYRIDVSVMPFALPTNQFDFMTIPVSMATTEEIIENYMIGLGNEVFMVGLFSGHSGQKKNLPIVRTGNLALMPDEPIEVKIMGMREKIDAFLIESRSIGGLSGSPVFIRADYVLKTKPSPPSPRTVFWLGLIHGHWGISVEPDAIEQDDVSIPKQEKVNMGIAIVVPATKIVEVINQDFFSDKRKERIEELEQKKSLSTLNKAEVDVNGESNSEILE